MWTNRVVSSNGSELFVEFTSPDNRKFIKRYKEIDTQDEQTLLESKLADIETMWQTFIAIRELSGSTQIIVDGWQFTFNNIIMGYDWIEITVEITSNYQTLMKRYNITEPRTAGYILTYIENEKSKIGEWISYKELAPLNEYFGAEVMLDGD